ncbi:MAG: tryptophan synthase subunit alpha [Endozoicomonadaceae bacterium]|nr:tryptophan synthase subunit alpha [Endozoicomonadaceae bacterium]MBE8233068.1 tryptophan synthase subunit alpha [Endozoicomonadaceae bacterium]
MSRLISCFNELKQLNRKALIPYITTGHPELKLSVELMHLLVKSGADIIELGVPFSDPFADGPVIEKAHDIAVAKGVGLSHVFDVVSEFRVLDKKTPIVLMSYLNPIEMLNNARFAEKANIAGVDAVLIVDCPPEESSALAKELNQVDIDMIFLVSPNTSDQRIKQIDQLSSGYIYYVSLKGVTGSNIPDIDHVVQRVNHVKTMTDLPVAVGFGVKDGKTAAEISQAADGVIVGAALVKELHDHIPTIAFTKIAEKLSDMRQAMNRAE